MQKECFWKEVKLLCITMTGEIEWMIISYKLWKIRFSKWNCIPLIEFFIKNGKWEILGYANASKKTMSKLCSATKTEGLSRSENVFA